MSHYEQPNAENTPERLSEEEIDRLWGEIDKRHNEREDKIAESDLPDWRKQTFTHWLEKEYHVEVNKISDGVVVPEFEEVSDAEMPADATFSQAEVANEWKESHEDLELITHDLMQSNLDEEVKSHLLRSFRFKFRDEFRRLEQLDKADA